MEQLYGYCRDAMGLRFVVEVPPNKEGRSFSLLLMLVYFVVF